VTLIAWQGAAKRATARCAKGHEWSTPGGALLRGSSCAICQRVTIEDAQARAHASIRIVEWNGVAKQARIVCTAGHAGTKLGMSVVAGNGCKACLRVTHEEAQARVRPGFTVEVWRGASAKASMRCEAGHRWMALGSNLLNGSGCRTCAGQDPITHEMAQARLLHRGYTVLHWTNAGGRCVLKCERGHEWDCYGYNAFNGYGCPTCSGCSTDNDCVYMWRDDSREFEGRHVYKIGVTSWSDGDARMRTCAKARGTQVSDLRRWRVTDARRIERHILATWGLFPGRDGKDGHTECRALTPCDVRDIDAFVTANASKALSPAARIRDGMRDAAVLRALRARAT
jgi:hypothetical protein